MFLYTCSAVLPSFAGDTCADASPDAASTNPATTTPHSARCISHLSGRGTGSGIIGNSSADHRHHRLDVLDLVGWNREVVAIQHHEIGELAGLDRPETT